MPAQGGAFHTDGHLGDVFQRDSGFQFFEDFFVSDFAANHIQEEAAQAEGIFHGALLEELGHHSRGGLADGAAGAGVGQVFDNAIFDFHFDVDVIAAARVVAVLVDGGTFQFSFIALILVIFQDQVSVQLFQFHQSSYPMTFRTPLSFSRK